MPQKIGNRSGERHDRLKPKTSNFGKLDECCKQAQPQQRAVIRHGQVGPRADVAKTRKQKFTSGKLGRSSRSAGKQKAFIRHAEIL